MEGGFMKKLKFIGIITLAALFAFSTMACSGGGKSLNSATELKEYLDKQPANSPDKPIKVAMKANDMMIGNIREVLQNTDKYVSLNLSGSPLTAIPDNAFSDRYGNGCKTLVDITIPNSVTSIGDNAFMNCTSLTSVTIPNGVTSIGSYAFSGTSLTSVTIPDSVTSIGGSAFYGTVSITVDSGNPNYTIEGGILYNKAKTEIVHVTINISGNVTIPNGVTRIGSYAFEDCTSLTSITIPNGVTGIGSYAFYGCTSLTSVIIPNSVTLIGRGAFSGTGLISVTIGSGVTFIGLDAFYCTSLTSVTFQGTIARAGFGEYNPVYESPFIGDLDDKYLSRAGGIGTYTTTAPVRYVSVWTKQ